MIGRRVVSCAGLALSGAMTKPVGAASAVSCPVDDSSSASTVHMVAPATRVPADACLPLWVVVVDRAGHARAVRPFR